MTPHLYLHSSPCLLTNTVQGHMPQGNKQSDYPLQASILVQRSSDSWFLSLSISFPQISKAPIFPCPANLCQGANTSSWNFLAPSPYRTLLWGSFNFILSILPCHYQRDKTWYVEKLQVWGWVQSPFLSHGHVTLGKLLYYVGCFFVCLLVYLDKYRCILFTGL